MPHALTERQKEYLDFIKNYIRENEDSPSLQEIANHFGVKSPTAHKILDALQVKDYIFFMRHPTLGFIIRLVERGGQGEKILPLKIVGKIDRYGELVDIIDFEAIEKEVEQIGYSALASIETIPILQKCDDPFSIFGLKASHAIPELLVEEGDIFVYDGEKMAQQEFLSLMPVGPSGRVFLCRSVGYSFDDRFMSFDMIAPYPLPEEFFDPDLGQRMFWHAAAWSDETEDYFLELYEEGGLTAAPVPSNLINGSVLQMIRRY